MDTVASVVAPRDVFGADWGHVVSFGNRKCPKQSMTGMADTITGLGWYVDVSCLGVMGSDDC